MMDLIISFVAGLTVGACLMLAAVIIGALVFGHASIRKGLGL